MKNLTKKQKKVLPSSDNRIYLDRFCFPGYKQVGKVSNISCTLWDYRLGHFVESGKKYRSRTNI